MKIVRTWEELPPPLRPGLLHLASLSMRHGGHLLVVSMDTTPLEVRPFGDGELREMANEEPVVVDLLQFDRAVVWSCGSLVKPSPAPLFKVEHFDNNSFELTLTDEGKRLSATVKGLAAEVRVRP